MSAQYDIVKAVRAETTARYELRRNNLEPRLWTAREWRLWLEKQPWHSDNLEEALLALEDIHEEIFY